MTRPADLLPIERQAWEAQTANAPAGHTVIGPAQAPPFWHCLECGATWSDGPHSDQYAAQIAEPDQSPAQAEPGGPERPLPYPFDA